jgi:hypothetical protein
MTMARVHVSCILAFFFFSNLCFCFNPKHLDSSAITGEWSTAGATWYGSPDGYGSDGNVHRERESEREREFFLLFNNCIYIMQEGLVDTAVQ